MSEMRKCEVFKAENQKYYLVLGNHEGAYESHECTTYGPFASSDAAVDAIDYFSNPGSIWEDHKGSRPVPSDVQAPPRPSRW